jgi:4-diphosphocytidyl-2-C-methyl-D-erythritol kinase
VNSPARLTALAPAKLNLGLAVVGAKPDGYHEIVTIMQSVSVYDRLSFEIDEEVEGPVLAVDNPSLAGDDNLVLRAARLLRRRTDTRHGVRIALRKGIPCAAGLGGGSSDAAVTLLALNRLWETHLDDEALFDLALELGSDVPFFLKGGTALATGRGERLLPLPPLRGVWFIAVVPSLLFPLTSKTSTLYAALAPRDFSEGLLVRSLPGTLESWFAPRPTTSFNAFPNAFLRPLLTLRPELRYVIGALEAAGAPFVCLTGAGPTFYTGADDRATADRLARLVGRRLADRATVLVAEPHAGSPRLIDR